MDAIYAEKFAEAQAVAAMDETQRNAMSPSDVAAVFPLVAASIGIDGPDAVSVAGVFLFKGAETLKALGGGERIRLSAKRAISAAQTVEDANAIYEAISWPARSDVIEAMTPIPDDFKSDAYLV
jgi:hypothetical protein